MKTWSDTYGSVVNPPAFQLRERQWREQFDRTDGSWFCFVVENRDGQLVGFAKGKAYASDEPPGYSGQLDKSICSASTSAWVWGGGSSDTSRGASWIRA